MTEGQTWIVRLTNAAAADQTAIVTWTTEQFGTVQARAYGDALSAALIALHGGPTTLGVMRRDELGKDICTLHVAREKRRGRHFIVFRVHGGVQPPLIEVLRILHDAMDLTRHLPGETEPDEA